MPAKASAPVPITTTRPKGVVVKAVPKFTYQDITDGLVASGVPKAPSLRTMHRLARTAGVTGYILNRRRYFTEVEKNRIIKAFWAGADAARW